MSLRQRVIVGLLVLLVSGCDHLRPVRPASTAPSEAVVVSRLNPQYLDAPQDASRHEVYGIEELAERVVTDADVARRLRLAVTDPANFDGPARGRCFLPRMLVRVADGPRWTDYVICTQCHRVDTHASDGKTDSLAISADGVEAFDALMAELFPGIAVRPVGDEP